MIIIQEGMAEHAAMKPVKCPKCGYRRVFDAPAGVCVRKSRRGKPLHEPTFILKCKRCGQAIGILFE